MKLNEAFIFFLAAAIFYMVFSVHEFLQTNLITTLMGLFSVFLCAVLMKMSTEKGVK